jgi:hypothetical protein
MLPPSQPSLEGAQFQATQKAPPFFHTVTGLVTLVEGTYLRQMPRKPSPGASALIKVSAQLDMPKTDSEYQEVSPYTLW